MPNAEQGDPEAKTAGEKELFNGSSLAGLR